MEKVLNARAPRGSRWSALVLVAVAAVAWVPVTWAGFIWDDDVFVLENVLLQAPDAFTRIWTSMALPDFYPLTWTMLALEWRLFGPHPLGYHLVNVAVHLASALLVWKVLERLRVPGAWWAALVFAVHPVTAASVAWIFENKNSLSLFFYALALYLYLGAVEHEKPVHRGRWTLAIVAFGLGLMCKTSGVLLPGLLLVFSWWRWGRVDRRDVLLSLPWWGLAVAFSFISLYTQHAVVAGAAVRPEGPLSRLAASGWAFWFYLYKIVLPVRLSMVYPRWDVKPDSFVAWLPLVALGVLAVVACRKRATWGRPLLFTLAWCLATLLPVLGVADIYYMRYALVADHWQYLSMIGVIALLVGGATALAGGLGPQGQRVARGAGLAVVGILMALTWRQACTYETPETLWRETLRVNPAAFVAHYNLGVILEGRDRLDEARQHFEQAVALNPGYAPPYLHLGGLQRLNGDASTAEQWYRRGLQVDPTSADLHYNLGVVLARQGRHDLAVEHYRRSVEQKPESAAAWSNLGAAWLETGHPDEAVSAFRRALAREPRSAVLWYNLGTALERQGEWGGALEAHAEALRLEPGLVQAESRLAWVYATASDPAFRRPEQAMQLIEPRCAATGYRDAGLVDVLAAACAAQGNFGRAVTLARQALETARAQGREPLAREIASHLGCYETMQPWISRPSPARP